MVDFISQNPATEAFDRQRANSQGTALRDIGIDAAQLRLDEARRTRDSEVAVDEALRDFMGSRGQQPAPAVPTQPQAPAQPVAVPGAGGPAASVPAPAPNRPVQPMANPRQPTSPLRDLTGLPERLATIPGAGQAALGLAQDQNKQIRAEQTATAKTEMEQRNADLDRFFESLKGNDVASIRFLGQRAGIEVPDAILNQAQLRQQLAQAGEYKKLYGNDVETFGRFLADAFQNGDDTAPAYRQSFIKNPPTNSVQSASNRNPVLLKAQWLMDNVGLDPERAYELANGNPLTVRSTVWTKVYAGAIANSMPQDEAAAEADAVTEAFLKSFGMFGQGGAGANPAAGGGEPTEVPRDSAGQVDETALVPNQVYQTPRGPHIWTGTGWRATGN